MPSRRRQIVVPDALRRKLEHLRARARREDECLPRRLTNQDMADALEAGLIAMSGPGTFELTERGLSLVSRNTTGSDEAHASASRKPRRRSRVTRVSETPLEWLHAHRDRQGRRWIDETHYEAGRCLARDFHAAAMGNRVTVIWELRDSVGSSGARQGRMEGTERQAAAAERTRAALAAVGPELSGILIDICCYENSLDVAEKAAGWPARSAKVVLKLALERLACHYGLAPVPRGRRQILHWGSENYRPKIDPGTIDG
ncbi:MAG: hypothetical protein RLZ98_2074 [Pseudomonadota bacterium]|jgi:hypothetical protein